MTYIHLTDLADIARRAGLRVVEVPGWKTRGRPASTGDFRPRGVLCHHTGSHVDDERGYASWLARQGRSDLPAPLCHYALGHDSTVYVCAAGRANHAGKARATGPMPAGDGNEDYVGIEAMNTGSEGWDSKGTDAHGNVITQRQGYERLCAALCAEYEWPASHVRAHKESSVTGKWDPGLLDMDQHRKAVGALVSTVFTNPEELDMGDITQITKRQDDQAEELQKVKEAQGRMERFLAHQAGGVTAYNKIVEGK